MSQRDLFYKWLFYSLAGLFWFSLQQFVFNSLDLWRGVHPFVLPMIPAMATLLERRQESAFFAIGAGLFCDLLIPASLPGFYSVTFFLTALLSALIAQRVIMQGFLCAFICSVAALVLGSLVHALFLSPSTPIPFAAVMALTGRELLLSIPLFPLVFLTFRNVHRRIRNE